MKNTKSALEKKKMILLLVAVVLVATVAFTFGFQLWKHGKKEKEKINRGVAYLESLEKQDISAISSKVDAMKAAYSLEMSETDENAVWGGCLLYTSIWKFAGICQWCTSQCGEKSGPD